MLYAHRICNDLVLTLPMQSTCPQQYQPYSNPNFYPLPNHYLIHLVHSKPYSVILCPPTCACMTDVNLELWFKVMYLSPAWRAPIIPPNKNPNNDTTHTVVEKSFSSLGTSSPYLWDTYMYVIINNSTIKAT